MKNVTILFAFISFAAFGQHDHARATVAQDTIKKSIPKEVHAQIGEAHMMIHYHAPAVRGRVIWGGLIPYGDVWVTGAHSATNWEFNKDMVIGNKTIPAGKYAIFTIPGKEKWTVIINKNWEQHLTDEYDKIDDLVRVEVMPKNLTVTQERLSYEISKESDNKGLLSISWEKIKLTIPFEIK
ncbi:MAG: DUF2911 domain-containing protein [Cyclobacteriaceae bacterium]|nr:DUF2911 domain-containing protein [Cyclobacteriaceae bacterium]